METNSLKWNELAHTQGDIPWKILDDFTEALIQTPSLWKELAARYDKITITEDYSGYEELYIPYLFAKAGPQLNNKTEIIPFLLEKLSETGRDDADYLLEAFSAACGSMGSVIVPYVLDAIEQEQNTVDAWVFLWSLLKLATGSQYESQVVEYCVEYLNQALNDKVSIADADEAAQLLAHFGCTEYVPLLKQLEVKSEDSLYYAEYREARRILEGKTSPYDITETWEQPPDKWLQSAWKAQQKWYQECATTQDEEDQEDYQFYVNDKLSWRFARTAFKDKISHISQDTLFFVSELVLNYAWIHHLAPPEKLNKDILKKILTGSLPRKAAITEPDFQYVPEITSAMLRWLQGQDILPEGQHLADKVLGWSDEIIANGTNRKLWDPGKKFSMEVLEKGYDLDDPDTFRDLTLDYNNYVDVFDEDDEDDYIPHIPIQEYPSKIGRNQPCPCGSGKKYKKCCGSVSLN